MADLQHWLDRWQQDRIGFHEADVNHHLRQRLAEFALPSSAQIFLPLCGKAHDIAWIARQGYEVIGIEISRIAVEAFFEEQQLEVEVDEDERFRRYRAPGITLLQGDFFDLRAEDLADCALVYDRAALIAMTRAQRPEYFAHMLAILPPSMRMLLITLEYDQAEMTGPPYAVWEDEVRANYGERYDIELLERNNTIDERERWRKVGLTALGEVVFRLEPRA